MDIFEDVDDVLFYNDLEELIEAVYPDREYNVRHRPDHFDLWDDNQFFRRFRLSKATVQRLLIEIEVRLLHRTQRNKPVSPLYQLLLTLRFCATGSFYVTLGDFSGIHKSTAANIINRVINAIADLRPRYVYMPRTDNEKSSSVQKFYDIARFPRVLGALDCTHIKLQSPGRQNAELFRNRKGYFSLNVQAVCNADLKITDLVVRWPGSAHDSHIFGNSALKMSFEAGRFENGLLLGDSGYAVRSYLMTPINNPNTEAENLYNESQIRTRNVVERMFGVWKRRSPVLSLGLRCRITLAQKIVVACAVLHNIACEENEQIPDDAPEMYDNNEEREEANIGNNAVRQELINYFSTLL